MLFLGCEMAAIGEQRDGIDLLTDRMWHTPDVLMKERQRIRVIEPFQVGGRSCLAAGLRPARARAFASSRLRGRLALFSLGFLDMPPLYVVILTL